MILEPINSRRPQQQKFMDLTPVLMHLILLSFTVSLLPSFLVLFFSILALKENTRLAQFTFVSFMTIGHWKNILGQMSSLDQG